MGSIRLLLALSVVAAHCGAIFGFTLVGGQIAVQSFYIISGFYMSLILNEKYVGANNSYKLFITNRFIRLYPLYWAVLIATLLFCIGSGYITQTRTMPIIDNYLTVKANVFSFAYLFLTNLVVFGQDVVMFLGIVPESGKLFFTSNFLAIQHPLYAFLFIPQAWTLGLELTFYLVAPFILRKGVKLVTVVILLSLLIRLIIYNYFNLRNDPWSYRFFPNEIMFFLFGYLSYRLHLVLNRKPLPAYVGTLVLVFSLTFTLLFEYLPTTRMTWFPFSFKEIIYFLTIILSIPVVFNFLKRSKLDNQIGELSYPVYISHFLVAAVCEGIATKYSVSFLKMGWVIALLVIVAAYLLNKIIASPLEKFRQARLKR